MGLAMLQDTPAAFSRSADSSRLSDKNVRPTLDKNYDHPRVKGVLAGGSGKPGRIEVGRPGQGTAPQSTEKDD